MQNVFGAGKGWFGVDHPFRLPRGGECLAKTLPIAQSGKTGEELEFAFIESLFEVLAQELKAHFEEQAVEQARKYADGQKESRTAGGPAGAAGGDSASANQTMQMRVM